jgi:hypothetical protein
MWFRLAVLLPVAASRSCTASDWPGFVDPCCVKHATADAATCNADNATGGGCTWCSFADIGGCTSVATAQAFATPLQCDKKDEPDACDAKYPDKSQNVTCAADTSTAGGCRWCTVAAWTASHTQCMSRTRAAFINATGGFAVGIECTP